MQEGLTNQHVQLQLQLQLQLLLVQLQLQLQTQPQLLEEAQITSGVTDTDLKRSGLLSGDALVSFWATPIETIPDATDLLGDCGSVPLA